MKIAVFGDSFGDDYTLWPNPYSGVGPSWVEYLQNQNIEVDNYASGGTSLFYSYQKFILTYQEYDKVIFLVTHPGRITVPLGHKTEDYYNITSVENKLKECFDFEKKIRLNAIRDYFIYVKNDAYDNVVHKLLIEDILKKHKDTLLIPCFHNSGINNQRALFNISHFEANFWNFEDTILPNRDEVYDARKCHMCEENNLVLGQEIYNWIKTGNYNLTAEQFKEPTKEFTHYFRKHFDIILGKRK
jgi:hypothetical protein